jgi:hypothetical protein
MNLNRVLVQRAQLDSPSQLIGFGCAMQFSYCRRLPLSAQAVFHFRGTLQLSSVYFSDSENTLVISGGTI